MSALTGAIAAGLVAVMLAAGFHVARQYTANECQAHLTFVVGGDRYLCLSVASLPVSEPKTSAPMPREERF